MNFTPLARFLLGRRVKEALSWTGRTQEIQLGQLDFLLRNLRQTKWGAEKGLSKVRSYDDFRRLLPSVSAYAGLRPYVMRMIAGEKDVLWPGLTRNFAQSSGTSDGKSKYIPVTPASFSRSHYKGGSSVISHYLSLYPDSRIFAGKSFILGGSFANELTLPPGVRVGDLSANLIENINPLVNLTRVPSKRIALLEDWAVKLPALVSAAADHDITNISGVPSWFLTVLKQIIKAKGAQTIHDVWPNLEVFFHGGISMAPYREQYSHITDPKMRYLECYNASEGFFAVQNAIDDQAMLLLLDCGTFFEFIRTEEADSDRPEIIPAWKVEEGEIYELVITSCNGLWRYPLGDTVRIESVEPLKITIAGRTKSYINAFGEELMVQNAEAALTKVCKTLDCEISNYTAAPVYASDHSRGRHEWLIEFNREPESIDEFARQLDLALQQENSDYEAKRNHGIFLDRLTIVKGRKGVFDKWLAATGKLGGQRKVPRLSNSRHPIDEILKYN
ncbi:MULTISPECIES: GH3 auxin-responsive promoter family protein [Duncaniella]|uniref:GH3 auxin-responsive promoter family protein n=1 Tax=Duncaniella TaxID=2518495 RepID=UPI0010A47ABB|nr:MULTISPECIES: GH3 auxin-responsive promoter family protein [Duncaniella]QCD38639.1 GH3 auxin-responsive promoter family protein [Duncaniella sp. C9]QCP72327.1 GH3 auxin-responsive promoter family protein [Duncaniella sp. B8]